MACKFDLLYIQEYAEGTIGPLEKIFAEEHLKTCGGCRQELNEYRLFFSSLNGPGLFDVSIPVEIFEVKVTLLRQMENAQTDRIGIKQLLDIQVKLIRDSSSYMSFIPGVKKGKKVISSAARKTPQLLFNTSTLLFRGGARLAQMR